MYLKHHNILCIKYSLQKYVVYIFFNYLLLVLSFVLRIRVAGKGTSKKDKQWTGFLNI